MNNIDVIINKFETQRFSNKKNSKTHGVFYTPWNIVKFIVSNSFKIYFEGLYDNSTYSRSIFDYDLIKDLLRENTSFQSTLKSIISKIKILDPSSGSGRFLISSADFLFNIYKLLNFNKNDYLIKKKIIQNQIYGIDIDCDANLISNLRLVNWLYKGLDSELSDMIKPDLNFSNIKKILNEIDLKSGILDEEYLLGFNQHNFDIILGNPPYIENKKISDRQFKKKISKTFTSAYKLFDLSVVFIEKSVNILNPKNGVLSFLTTNKFLAADYGIKIREFLLKFTQIREIINISSINSFRETSIYPIILLLKKGQNLSNNISLQKFASLHGFEKHSGEHIYKFSQEKIYNFPSYTIPLSDNIELIDKVYSINNLLSETLKDLKIIYRPFGFINWAKNSKNIIEGALSSRDMILLGTGNIKRYYIDFNKPVKVGQNKYLNPFFRYEEKHKDIWRELSSEKLIFREIAKDLSFVYDPGLIVNLTGLYFLQVPSYNTNQLFGLLAILNSKLINTIFKSLYGTLHMSSGYLRFNGSFIKRLPIPKKIPKIIGIFGKILYILVQLKFELKIDPNNSQFIGINPDEIDILLGYYENLTNDLVEQLYLDNHSSNYFSYQGTYIKNLPDFNFKFIGTYSQFPKFEIYSKQEIDLILGKISSFFNEYKES